jgi:hypothetical protein
MGARIHARRRLCTIGVEQASEVGVRIETNQDLQTAIARLASRTPGTLATFIASLAFDIGPIGEQVRTFNVGDNLSETTASLKERIEARILGIEPMKRWVKGSVTFWIRLRRWYCP